jgi:hypothetical protein
MPTPLNLFSNDNDTNVAQTWFQLIGAGGNVTQEFDSNLASGDGAVALGDATLYGSQIITGDVAGPVVNGTDNNVAFGNGAVAVQDAGNVNIGSGTQVNIQDSMLSETAIGDGAVVQSNDITASAQDGSAISFGGNAEGDGDTSVQANGNDGPVSVVDGDDNAVQQLHDESWDWDASTTLDLAVAIDESFNTDNSTAFVDSFKTMIDASIDDNDGVDVA